MSLALFSLVEFLDNPDGDHALVAEGGVERVEKMKDVGVDYDRTFFLDLDDVIEKVFEEVGQIFIGVHDVVLHMVDEFLHEGVDVAIVPLDEQSFRLPRKIGNYPHEFLSLVDLHVFQTDLHQLQDLQGITRKCFIYRLVLLGIFQLINDRSQ